MSSRTYSGKNLKASGCSSFKGNLEKLALEYMHVWMFLLDSLVRGII